MTLNPKSQLLAAKGESPVQLFEQVQALLSLHRYKKAMKPAS